MYILYLYITKKYICKIFFKRALRKDSRRERMYDSKSWIFQTNPMLH